MNIFEYKNHKFKVIRNMLTYTIVSSIHTLPAKMINTS